MNFEARASSSPASDTMHGNCGPESGDVLASMPFMGCSCGIKVKVHLQESSLVKECADVADDSCSPDEDVAHEGIHNCVQIPLPVARLLHH